MPGKASWNDFTPLRPTLESGQIDQKPYVQIGWVLRETTCWNEYAFLDSPDQVCFISNAKEKIIKERKLKVTKSKNVFLKLGRKCFEGFLP